MDSKDRVGMFVTSDPDVTRMDTQPEGSRPTARTTLPLRLLYAADLAPTAPGAEAREATTHRVDKNRFGDLFQALQPALVLDVPNRVAQTPKRLEVELTFRSLADFEPAQVAAQVPALAQLLEIRKLVAQVKAGDIDLDAFQERLGSLGVDDDWTRSLYDTLRKGPSEPAAKRSDEGSALDRLMGLVEGGEPAPAAKPQEDSAQGGSGGLLDALVGAVAGESGSRPAIEKTVADQLLADLDAVLSEQTGELFGAPDFRRLEAAWRGLKFLVDRLRFADGIELDVLAVTRTRLIEDLYHHVLLPEHSADHDRVPLSALVLDFAFTNSSADVDLLDDLAETGASLQAPILVGAAPGFFGLEQAAGLSRLPVLWQHLEGPEYIEWNKLRDRKEATQLALALPAFALRYAYGDEHPARGFAFTEAQPLWGTASIAVGALMAGSYAETGWPTHILGAARQLDNLPLGPKSGPGRSPLAALIPDSKLGELAKAGFCVLGAKPNHDAIHLARAVTVGRPEAHEDLMAATEAKIHVTLPTQLFVARAAHAILTLQEELPAVEDVAQTQQQVEASLRSFLRASGKMAPPEAVEVEPVEQQAAPGHRLYAVRLRAPSTILPRPVSVVLGLQVPEAAES